MCISLVMKDVVVIIEGFLIVIGISILWLLSWKYLVIFSGSWKVLIMFLIMLLVVVSGRLLGWFSRICLELFSLVRCVILVKCCGGVRLWNLGRCELVVECLLLCMCWFFFLLLYEDMEGVVGCVFLFSVGRIVRVYYCVWV